MIKILIGIAAFALATTGQVSLAGTSQVSYSSASNHIILAHKNRTSHGLEKRCNNCTCHTQKYDGWLHKDFKYHKNCPKT